MTATPLRYFVVDAFTNRRFTGNPAAIVPLAKWEPDQWLQNVAMEMNLSETAYLVPNDSGFDLRWFTPKAEVDLCGHATIAAAIVLVQLGELSAGGRVAFSTRSGVLTAVRRGSRIQLDFPALTVTACEPPPGLLAALGDVTARYVGRGKFDYLVEVEYESAVRGIAPDFKRLATVDCRGVIVTACSDAARSDTAHNGAANSNASNSSAPLFDFVSRFFAPALGIDEDPVTGSAHCLLAPYWGERLGKSAMIGYQASTRGGTIYVETRGDRVLLEGEGIIFATGELTTD
jgi:predicted PhzF superfamily epimerase YddE/YHI9